MESLDILLRELKQKEELGVLTVFLDPRNDHLFIKNKYFKWYIEMMLKAEERYKSGIYVEGEDHHIFSKCLGGPDKKNMVRLTYREHLDAHIMLIYFVKEEYRDGLNKAIEFMLKDLKKYGVKIRPKLYEKIKLALRNTYKIYKIYNLETEELVFEGVQGELKDRFKLSSRYCNIFKHIYADEKVYNILKIERKWVSENGKQYVGRTLDFLKKYKFSKMKYGTAYSIITGNTTVIKGSDNLQWSIESKLNMDFDFDKPTFITLYDKDGNSITGNFKELLNKTGIKSSHLKSLIQGFRRITKGYVIDKKYIPLLNKYNFFDNNGKFIDLNTNEIFEMTYGELYKNKFINYEKSRSFNFYYKSTLLLNNIMIYNVYLELNKKYYFRDKDNKIYYESGFDIANILNISNLSLIYKLIKGKIKSLNKYKKLKLVEPKNKIFIWRHLVYGEVKMIQADFCNNYNITEYYASLMKNGKYDINTMVDGWQCVACVIG